jgi:hypothetical protein
MARMGDEVRTRSGHRIVPPAELPPGAIGWNIYEQEDPGELGHPSDGSWEFIGFIPRQRWWQRRIRRRRSASNCSASP